MNFKSFKSHLHFTKYQRTGIFLLLISITVLQLIYLFADFTISEEKTPDKEKWLTLQSEIDIEKAAKKSGTPVKYLFNPNFISDYKGYKLGMSVDEIDRLLAFRKENKYVNSAEEFQKVTGISDSLFSRISPLFKFPDWIQHKTEFKSYKNNYERPDFTKKQKFEIIDINQATQEDLIKIYGIGEGISTRILKQKEILGCFVSMDQMDDIWGLSPEVVKELHSHFKVIIPSTFKRININEGSLKELSQFPYFKYALAKQIVTYRSMNGDFKNIEDLAKIKDFPVEKAKIISLYLEY